jgi:hypothetical protein
VKQPHRGGPTTAPKDVRLDTLPESACVICYDKEADTMVLPCGHTVVCWACYTLLEKSCDYRTCVQCLQPVERAVLVLD